MTWALAQLSGRLDPLPPHPVLGLCALGTDLLSSLYFPSCLSQPFLLFLPFQPLLSGLLSAPVAEPGSVCGQPWACPCLLGAGHQPATPWASLKFPLCDLVCVLGGGVFTPKMSRLPHCPLAFQPHPQTALPPVPRLGDMAWGAVLCALVPSSGDLAPRSRWEHRVFCGCRAGLRVPAAPPSSQTVCPALRLL